MYPVFNKPLNSARIIFSNQDSFFVLASDILEFNFQDITFSTRLNKEADNVFEVFPFCKSFFFAFKPDIRIELYDNSNHLLPVSLEERLKERDIVSVELEFTDADIAEIELRGFDNAQRLSYSPDEMMLTSKPVCTAARNIR